MKTILVPTDFSANAANAIHYAAALSSRTGYKIILLHAIEPEVIEIPGNPFVRKVDTRLENYYLAKLQKLAEQIQQQTNNTQVETLCVPGPFPLQLNSLISDKQVDLVVMGTKGAHNIFNKFLGTNTANLIKNAKCPVLAIPANVQFKEIKNVAYASDFERSDIIFLKQLFLFSEPLKANIFIFNIKSDEQLNLVSDQQILYNIRRRFPDKNLSFAQLQENNIVAGIKAFVQENQIDVLAVAVHQHNLLDKILDSSISQKLVFSSPVPLLALPENPVVKQRTTGENLSLEVN